MAPSGPRQPQTPIYQMRSLEPCEAAKGSQDRAEARARATQGTQALPVGRTQVKVPLPERTTLGMGTAGVHAGPRAPGLSPPGPAGVGRGWGERRSGLERTVAGERGQKVPSLREC